MITLQWQGKQPVTVQVPQKNKEGIVTHYKPHETNRNQWSMTPLGGERVQTGSDEMVKLSAFDANRFTQVQRNLVTHLQITMPAPSAPADGLYWLRPDGQGSQNSGDALSASRPAHNEKAGERVMSAWGADGRPDIYLVQGDGDYLQGVIRREGEFQHVLVSLPDNKESPPMVFNLITPDGAVPIGSGNGINRSHGTPVPREYVVLRLQGDEQQRIAKLDAPQDMPPSMHARLGFDERWKAEAGFPKDRPVAAPQVAPVAPVSPQRPA
jgi:putative DNA primase/helicase